LGIHIQKISTQLSKEACFNAARTAISFAAVLHFIERLQVPFPFVPFFVVQVPNFFQLYVHCLQVLLGILDVSFEGGKQITFAMALHRLFFN
jgi:hypothetical protein